MKIHFLVLLFTIFAAASLRAQVPEGVQPPVDPSSQAEPMVSDPAEGALTHGLPSRDSSKVACGVGLPPCQFPLICVRGQCVIEQGQGNRCAVDASCPPGYRCLGGRCARR